MAHHSLRRAPGTWIGVVTPQDFEFFDLMQFRSIDGDAGGTWNPSAWIMLGGSYGLRIGSTAALQVDGNGSILGNVVIGSSESNELSVNSNTRFEHNAEALGDIIAGGMFYNAGNCDFCGNASDTFRVRGTGDFDENVTFDKAVTVAGVTTLNGNMVFGNAGSDTITVNATTNVHANVDVKAGHDFGVSGNSYFSGDVHINYAGSPATTTFHGGVVSLQCPLTAGSNGYLAKRVVVFGSGNTASLVNHDYAIVPEAGVVYVASEGDDGAVLRIVNASSGSLAVQTPAAHTLRTLSAHTWIDLVRDSTWGSNGWSSVGEGTYTALS